MNIKQTILYELFGENLYHEFRENTLLHIECFNVEFFNSYLVAIYITQDDSFLESWYKVIKNNKSDEFEYQYFVEFENGHILYTFNEENTEHIDKQYFILDEFDKTLNSKKHGFKEFNCEFYYMRKLLK